MFSQLECAVIAIRILFPFIHMLDFFFFFKPISLCPLRSLPKHFPLIYMHSASDFISTYLMLLGLFHSYQLYPWNYKFFRARNLFYVFFSCQLLAKNLAYKKAWMLIVWAKVMWKWIKNHLKVKGWWGHICTHGLFMSMYGKNHHNIVK